MSKARTPLVVNGWTLFEHPLFTEQVAKLASEVEQLRKKDPKGYTKKNATKRLAAIRKLTIDVIPQDPTRPEYRQGSALGEEYRHWFRAKFFQQYRLFFRYHAQSRIILYVWVNDDETRRAYDSSSGAYHVFRKMLESGRPPDGWEELIADLQHFNARQEP
jgi:toxin YhaV